MFENLKAAFKAKLSLVEVALYVKWILTYALKGNWQLGSEMGHWAVSVRRYRRQDPTWVQPMPEHIIPIVDFLKKFFNEEICVLELGPGPLSRLSKGYTQGLYDLVSVDPLASEYKKKFVDFKFLVEGFGEMVNEMFPPKSFHMSYASNSIDHSSDPLKCFRNMFLLTKIGGMVSIECNVREGTRAKWTGLHQWDMWMEGDGIMCKHRHGEPFELTEGLPLEKFEYHDHKDIEGAREWFSITYRKLLDYS